MRHLSDVVRDQKPLTLPPSATVKEACQCMNDRHLGAVLVTEKHGRFIGIFTGRDAVCRVLAAGKSAATTKLKDVMTAGPVTMPPDKTVIDALRLMWDGGFRHVPVIHDDKVVGVVSRGDFKGLEQTAWKKSASFGSGSKPSGRQRQRLVAAAAITRASRDPGPQAADRRAPSVHPL